MTLGLGMITLDTTDATSLAAGWAGVTGARVVQDYDGAFLDRKSVV